ncbi:MAG: hypothetical protein U5O39_05670 [Gammaproteobacteria bacterium]|nr:hypothetical protein [Gammaproteobacteria bacterium]
MPEHNFSAPAGRIETITISSKALSNNVLGDPSERQVAVYLPPGYDEASEEYPLFVDIVGFTGSGLGHIGWKAFGESVPPAGGSPRGCRQDGSGYRRIA